MGYYEFKIKVINEAKDALCGILFKSGALGIIENQDDVVVYFDDTLGIDYIKRIITCALYTLEGAGFKLKISFDYVYIGERDWNESWKKRFLPIEVGNNLVVLPPWVEHFSTKIPIIIDPGMAFGTGHHETTKKCLQYLEYFCHKDCAKNSFLDFGTGTGILAIAALKLGFSYAVGIDLDPLAIDAAKRNAKLNGLHSLQIIHGSIDAIKTKFDMIAANLMSEVLIQNANEIVRCLNKGCYALLSGMIVGQDEDVIKSMQNVGLTLFGKYYDDRWVSLIMQNC